MTSKPIPRDNLNYDNLNEYGRMLGREALLAKINWAAKYNRIAIAAKLLKDRKCCKGDSK